MGETLVKYWPIIIAIIGYIAWLTHLESSVVELKKWRKEKEEQDQARDKKSDARDVIVEQMALDIREMKTDIRWIKENKHL